MALCAAALALGACGEDTRNEANVLIDRVRSIDIELPLEVRRARVAALRELAPRDPDVRRAKEVCLRMHESLVTAETEQNKARRIFAMFRGGGTPSTRQREDIDRALRASEAATKRAQRSLDACTRQVADLELRFGTRRAVPPRSDSPP